MSTVEEIAAAARSLKLEDRVRLAEELLASIDDPSSAECLDLWAEVAERRLRDVRSGAARTVPASETMRKAEAILR